jgi:SOS-response transcriptional repressor LexA
MTKHDRFRRDHILDVIEDFQVTYGHPPSVRDIMRRVGLASPAAVDYHLGQLERDGLIVKCQCGCSRARVA